MRWVSTITLLIVLADQWTKKTFFIDYAFGPGWLTPLLRLTQHKNKGIGFDLPLPTWLIFMLSIFMILGILWMIILGCQQRERTLCFSSAIILGGAIGNLFDRIAYGYVRDWLLLGGRSVINLSDLAILFGCSWLFFFNGHVDKSPVMAKFRGSKEIIDTF